MNIEVLQSEKLVVAAGRAGIQEGVPIRATFEEIRVAPAFGLNPALIFFCNARIRGADELITSNPPRNLLVRLIGEKRLAEAAGSDLQKQALETYLQAAGVELLWHGNELICDFTDAVITKEDEEPERLEIPIPLPEPQAEPQSDPEETEPVPVMARAAR